MEKNFIVKLNNEKILRILLLLSICTAFPFASFGQGQENALAFFGIILHLVILIFIILPLTFLLYKRIKTGKRLFSFFIYLWSIPSLLWLGYAVYDSIFDHEEKMDSWSYLILCYFLVVLTYLILILKRDIKK